MNRIQGRFATFAEFAYLAVERLGNTPEKPGLTPDEVNVWKGLVHGLVFGIDLFERTYNPFPESILIQDAMPSPDVLTRMLESGRDPRPDPERIERVLNRIEYFEGKDAAIKPPPGSILKYWGALLYRLSLPKSIGMLDDWVEAPS